MIEVQVAPETSVKVKTVSDVLEHAARYIEEFGWSQGNFHGRGGQRCALSAIIWATGGDCTKPGPARELYVAASRACERYLATTLGGRHSVIGYNDAVSTTREDVLAMLRGAAAVTK